MSRPAAGAQIVAPRRWVRYLSSPARRPGVAGGARAGINTLSGEVEDLTEQNLTDVYTSKVWALKLATDAAITVLSVDQIIMAKQAGGKK